MLLERNLRTLENNLTDSRNEGGNTIRLKSGKKKLLPAGVTDFIEHEGNTEDKLNLDRINRGYAGIKTGIYEKRRRKACMDRNVPIDVYHQV